MLRLRKMERIVESDYAMDRHKTMTLAMAGTSLASPETGAPGPFTGYSRLL